MWVLRCLSMNKPHTSLPTWEKAHDHLSSLYFPNMLKAPQKTWPGTITWKLGGKQKTSGKEERQPNPIP